MFLIITPNVISILLGWDSLGLVSYLLLIYYQNMRSYGAGILIVLSNRIGDFALLKVIAWIINFDSWSFIYYLEILSGPVEMELISFLVVLAAMTKSAQIPFSSSVLSLCMHVCLFIHMYMVTGKWCILMYWIMWKHYIYMYVTCRQKAHLSLRQGSLDHKNMRMPNWTSLLEHFQMKSWNWHCEISFWKWKKECMAEVWALWRYFNVA